MAVVKKPPNRPTNGVDPFSSSGRFYGIQAGFHRFFYPAGFPTPNPSSGKGVVEALIENLRYKPVETAKHFAECLTPAERGALVYAMRKRNALEGIGDLEEAFLEADSNMDAKLSKEEFAAYLAVRREQQRRSDLRSAAAAAACAGATAKPTRNQLLLIAFASGIPFIGFGFCDNAIMLLAGEGIESSLGVTLGISTLAAAGLGNLISDVAGLGLADSIGRQARRFGVREPRLSPDQRRMPSTRGARSAGAVVGVTIGCLMGMVPLLFLEHAQKDPQPNQTKAAEDE